MALLSEEEKQQLKQIMADYPNNEDLDLTAYIADVIGITGKHVEEGWYKRNRRVFFCEYQYCLPPGKTNV